MSAHVGLSAGRVRVATFGSALVAVVPRAAAQLADRHPGITLEVFDTHPPEAPGMLRAGAVDAAVVFRSDEAPPEADPSG